jgi:hypothetical protein
MLTLILLGIVKANDMMEKTKIIIYRLLVLFIIAFFSFPTKAQNRMLVLRQKGAVYLKCEEIDSTIFINSAHDGTKEDPMTVGESISFAQLMGSKYSFTSYTKGIINSIQKISLQKGEANFSIVDKKNDEDSLILCGVRYLQNTSFLNNEQIYIGDTVIVFRNVLYNDSTNELSEKLVLYSINGYIGEDIDNKYIRVPNHIYVNSNGSGDYTSLVDALKKAGDNENNHVTIIVGPGTYYMPPKVSYVEPYTEASRNITIKGVDKNTCILYNDIGFYDYTIGTDCTPLRLNGNVTIENLTIKSLSTEFDNYVNTEGYIPRDDYRKIAYCIHRDGSNGPNTMFTVKNCILINDHMACIGFGLRPNTELVIEDCYLQSEQAQEHSKADEYGTIYGHFYHNQTGLNQNLSIVRCQIVNKTSYQAINIMDAKSPAATPADTFGTFKFIGNATDTSRPDDSLVISSTLEGFYNIDTLSFGNRWEW